jgi:hypothetical protein
MTLPYLGFDDLPKPPALDELWFPLQHEPPALAPVHPAIKTLGRAIARPVRQQIRAETGAFTRALERAERALAIAEAAAAPPTQHVPEPGYPAPGFHPAAVRLPKQGNDR